MAFSPEQTKEIVEILNSKIRGCQACGQQGSWRLMFDALFVPLRGGVQSLPCVVLICQNCGNTQLHHVFTLGLGPLLGIEQAPQT